MTQDVNVLILTDGCLVGLVIEIDREENSLRSTEADPGCLAEMMVVWLGLGHPVALISAKMRQSEGFTGRCIFDCNETYASNEPLHGINSPASIQPIPESLLLKLTMFLFVIWDAEFDSVMSY